MMRTNFLFITTLCLLIFACDSDDDTLPQVELTANNYLFEAEVTQEFYAKTLADLQVNDPNNVDGIKEAEADLNNYNVYLDNLLQTVGVDVIGPPPPCPDSIVGELCFPNEGLFLMPVGVNASFRILTDSGDELATVNGQPQTLPNSNGALNYYLYSFSSNVNGPIQLEITRIDAASNLTYSIGGYVR